MKILNTSSDSYQVFLNNIEINKYDFFSENDLKDLLKTIFLNLEQTLNYKIKGMFQVEILFNKKAGCLLNIEKSNSSFWMKDVDLKINIIFDYDFYFKTECYDVVSDYRDIYYYKNKYYINIDKLDNIIKYIEFGDIVDSSIIKKEYLKKIN